MVRTVRSCARGEAVRSHLADHVAHRDPIRDVIENADRLFERELLTLCFSGGRSWWADLASLTSAGAALNKARR